MAISVKKIKQVNESFLSNIYLFKRQSNRTSMCSGHNVNLTCCYAAILAPIFSLIKNCDITYISDLFKRLCILHNQIHITWNLATSFVLLECLKKSNSLHLNSSPQLLALSILWCLSWNVELSPLSNGKTLPVTNNPVSTYPPGKFKPSFLLSGEPYSL